MFHSGCLSIINSKSSKMNITIKSILLLKYFYAQKNYLFYKVVGNKWVKLDSKKSDEDTTRLLLWTPNKPHTFFTALNLNLFCLNVRYNFSIKWIATIAKILFYNNCNAWSSLWVDRILPLLFSLKERRENGVWKQGLSEICPSWTILIYFEDSITMFYFICVL